MKNYTVFIALLLSACFGVSRQDFLQDTQNAEKSTELRNKRNKSADCDKLATLDKFTKLKSPKSEDLSAITPIFGLKNADSTNIDKVFNLDYSKIDKLNCVDNAEQLMTERAQYCDNKYRNDSSYQQYCKYFLKQAIFENGADYTEIDKQKLKQGIKDKISQIYTMPEDVNYLLSEFKTNELIKANNEILGKYDRACDVTHGFDRMVASYNQGAWLFPHLCSQEDKSVTKLDAIKLLNFYCLYNNIFPDKYDEFTCVCYAHETYNKVNYKNLVYIFETGKIPQSKKTEFNQIYEKCEQKIENQRIKAEKERYGEAKSANSDENNVFIEALENAAWAHRTITETRKKAENKQ